MKLLFCFSMVIMACLFKEVMNCQSADDCAPDECCRLGMDRYVTPFCQKIGQRGDSCIPGNFPEDKILSYPDGSTLKVRGVYRLMCPCQSFLQCDEGICQ
ncbi:astakine-like [Centruroides sculpturatus]|uniref:astakine-like n=1 Tax=Centruroides sculpturatus TaxID=218467 RepID=UPI000C6D6212|nr:astakine-like [Centruroides sculpturatus]